MTSWQERERLKVLEKRCKEHEQYAAERQAKVNAICESAWLNGMSYGQYIAERSKIMNTTDIQVFENTDFGMGEGDSAKAYTLDAVQAMYDPDRRHSGSWWENTEAHTMMCSACRTEYKTDSLTLVHRKGETVWDYEEPHYCPACGAKLR